MRYLKKGNNVLHQWYLIFVSQSHSLPLIYPFSHFPDVGYVENCRDLGFDLHVRIISMSIGYLAQFKHELCGACLC